MAALAKLEKDVSELVRRPLYEWSTFLCALKSTTEFYDKFDALPLCPATKKGKFRGLSRYK